MKTTRLIRTTLFALSTLFSNTHSINAQITVTNPGFEGTPGTTNTAPPNWTACQNSPDIGPGMWGMNIPPSQGSSYVYIGAAADGTTTGFVNTESVGASLSAPLLAGVCYEFQIDIISFQGVNDGERWESSLSVYGGTTSCAQSQLLWNSGPIQYNGASGVCNAPREDGNWTTFTVSFTPTANYNFIRFRHEGVANRVMCGSCCWDWGGAGVGIDNMTSITTCSVLPVELANFHAECDQNQVTLNWETLSEQNNSHFAIERSVDGQQFVEIDQVQGIGNSTTTNQYNWNSPTKNNGAEYYRLRQVDNDGSYTYSDIIVINCNSTETPFLTLTPNPTNSVVEVLLANVSENYTIQILDARGRIVRLVEDVEPHKQQRIDVTNIAGGVYYVRAFADSKHYAEKLMITE